MKKTICLLNFFFLLFSTLLGQGIEGNWLGSLEVMGTKMRLGFTIKKENNLYKSTMDSPEQNVFDIPTTSTQFENNKLIIKFDQAKITYTGTFVNDSTIEGSFEQNGFSAELHLSKQIKEIIKPNRPQEPKPPFSYYSEEITFNNVKDNVTLAGTLTLPQKEGKFPIVILVSGSGPQNRNEEIMGHKPFWVIADYFAKNGIGVLRYDDRGVAQSTGDFKTATSFDFANDAEAAVQYLSKRNETQKIGIVGHSEGGLIAPIVASKNKEVNFVILLAGPGVRGDKILLEQSYLIEKANGSSEKDLQKTKKINEKIYSTVLKSKNTTLLKNELAQLISDYNKSNAKEDRIDENQKKSLIEEMTSPWMVQFIKYDPAINLKKLKCKVLAINGSLDLQVPSQQNLQAIQKNVQLGGNKNVTIKEFKGLNHLFQKTTTGKPSEYGTLEESFHEEVMKYMAQWISLLK